MLPLPPEIIQFVNNFAPVFSQRVWAHALVLLLGAILTPGKRTVTSALRIMGLADEQHFINYHRVLSRARWSSLALSRVLLRLLVQTFVPNGPLIIGLDDTIERRRGEQIKAKGIYRDPVRSSRRHFVKASGLRWLSVMLLAPIPWAARVWALPFLTILAPSERYYQKRQRPHKKLTDWARQAMVQVRRWLPERRIVLLADSSFAALPLLGPLSRKPNLICCISRLRLDAALYQPAPKRRPGQKGRSQVKGERLPSLTKVLTRRATAWTTLTTRVWYGQFERTIEYATGTAWWYRSGQPPLPIRWVLVRDPEGKFEPQALLCTDVNVAPDQIIVWYARRWQVEVTFEEVRAQLDVETQRQWSDLAIARTTPALLGLFSLVTLLAHELVHSQSFPVAQSAWYLKPHPTFADTLALVRRHVWRHIYFCMSQRKTDRTRVAATLFKRLFDALAYAN
jgi:hypothetical protein